ncbi:MAG: hypothetical protein IKL53_06000, partial [Lachnospiraceae bacterium]|nr:hypothetical protein [Lachnospiraceae bacterium]
MADKRFSEVFPSVDLGRELNDLIGQTKVTAISVDQDKQELMVHIVSDNLIDLTDIERAQKIIAKEVFGNSEATCIIRDTYELSSQYNLESLVNMYKESILLEVKHESHFDYRILKRGAWMVEEGHIRLAVEDSTISRAHSKQMSDIISGSLSRRFGMEVVVDIEFTDDKRTNHRKVNEIKLKNELEEIEKRNAIIAENVAEDNKQAEAEKPKSDKVTEKTTNEKKNVTEADKTQSADKQVADSSQTSAPKQERSGKVANSPDKTNKSGFKGRGKQSSSDPDVIYGQNVEGELVSIADLNDGDGPCV